MPHPNPPGRSRRDLPLPRAAQRGLASALLLGVSSLGVLACLALGFVGNLTLALWFLLAEALALLGATLDVALETHSRSVMLDMSPDPERTKRVLTRYGEHRLDARLVRFLGTSLLVACVAWIAFRGYPIGAEGTPWSGILLVVTVTFGVTFLVNEMLVTVLVRRRPERFLLACLPVLQGLRIVLAPLRIPLVWLVQFVFRVRIDGGAQTARQDVLDSVEEGEREGSLTPDEADMIESIIDLGGSTVRDVMTTRADVIMLPAHTPVDEAIGRITEEGVSRVPVFGKDRDDVVGVLYARDLLAHWHDPRARVEDDAERLQVHQVMRSDAFFVPEGKLVAELLTEMRGGKVHLAVVVDEFGGTAGLVTIEDLLEEIVGEIRDEYDDEEDEAEGTLEPPVAGEPLEVTGRTPIEDVNRALEVALPVEEDFETMGGLVFHRVGSVPDEGARLELGDVELLVLETDDRTVKRLRVRRRSEPLANGDADEA